MIQGTNALVPFLLTDGYILAQGTPNGGHRSNRRIARSNDNCSGLTRSLPWRLTPPTRSPTTSGPMAPHPVNVQRTISHGESANRKCLLGLFRLTLLFVGREA